MAFSVDPQARYTPSHEWVRRENNLLTIGITDFAQHELSDVVYVEVPAVGEHVNAGDPLGAFESVKAAEEVYSPVSGTIVEVNGDLADNPQLVNSDPYGSAWLVKVAPDNQAEYEALMDAEAYQASQTV